MKISDETTRHSNKSNFSRRRPGTGRKLPSIPAGEKASPANSEVSSKLSSAGSPSMASVPEDDSARQKAVTISSHVVSKYQDTDTESVSRTKFSSDTDSLVTPKSSSRTMIDSVETPKSSSRTVTEDDRISTRSSKSSGSMDTDLLLKDTVSVMAAMEARIGSKPRHKSRSPEVVHTNGNANETFSDDESMVAMVNGDDKYVKPQQFESPRQILARANTVKARSTEKTPQKPLLSRANSATSRLNAFRDNNLKRQNSMEAPLSDIMSDMTMNGTEISTDGSDSNFTRSSTGSKGKGKMTMTRPNRAFQLRRARADGDVPPESVTPSSDVSSSVSRGSLNASSSSQRATPKSRRSLASDKSSDVVMRRSESSSRGAPRTRHSMVSDRTVDSARSSEASLGAQIVSKSRSNARSTGDLFRRDGGRHSLRLQRTNSSQDNSVLSTPPDNHKTDLKAIKSRLKNNSSSYGLTVTGVKTASKAPTSSSTQSRSHANSPKSAERAAWKRRKDYDPRRAVAEAKTKARDVKVTSDPSGPRMYRSASFTNSAEMRRFRKDNLQDSSADDASSCTNSEVLDTSLEQRGFIPYSNRSLSSRLYSNNSEDDDMGLMSRSSQVSTCKLRLKKNIGWGGGRWHGFHNHYKYIALISELYMHAV